MKKTYNLPTRQGRKQRTTTSAKTLEREWKALAKVIEDVSEGKYQATGFDPGIKFCYENTGHCLDLSTDLIFQIKDALQQAYWEGLNDTPNI